MGPPPAAVMRVVLDTNTVVSALLFTGTASALVSHWQSQRISLLLSGPMLEEYLRVLAYPKFRLTAEDVRWLSSKSSSRGVSPGPSRSAARTLSLRSVNIK